MEQIFLSRRNLQTLLNKLDRAKAGEFTACTIIKNDTVHPIYPQTISQVMITAVEDEQYYVDRTAGDVHPADDPAQRAVQ